MSPSHLGDTPPTADQTREEYDVRQDLKDAQSGDLAHPFHDRNRETIYRTENPMRPPEAEEYAPNDPMLIPTAQQAENMCERDHRMRARRGGLPDSPDEEMPAIAVPGGTPFANLKG